MKSRKNFVIGLCVTGSDAYWAMALNTILSIRQHADIALTKILIATDQEEKFRRLVQLTSILDCETLRVIPRDFYQTLVPMMKGNYATYWKFDLFHALTDDEVLMYIDVDAFAIAPLNLVSVVNLFKESSIRLAAVPAQRPVLERVAAVRLKSPFDYFNAGVLFGVKDSRYEQESIRAAFENIMKFDTLNVFWHDQDIFNFLFRDDSFKLPYAYNVSTGYLSKHYRLPYMLNDLASDDIERNGKVMHVSGDFLLCRRFHPSKKRYLRLVELSLDMIDRNHPDQEVEWAGLWTALHHLRDNAAYTKRDYYLQCAGLRERAFAPYFYNRGIKRALKRALNILGNK